MSLRAFCGLVVLAFPLPCRELFSSKRPSQLTSSHKSGSWPEQAQGLWRMLQGKPKDEREEQAQRAPGSALDLGRSGSGRRTGKMDDEWASRGRSGKLCT